MADPVAPFLWGAGGVRLTPEEVAAQRKYGQGLLAQGVDYSPIQSPWQGAARIAQALMGGWETGQADYAAKQNGAESASVIAQSLALANGGATPSAVPAAASMPGTPSAPIDITPNAAAIRSGLIQRGLPEHVADGFLMNFKDESGLNPGLNEAAPIVPGSRGGYGLAQWTGPRRVGLEQYAAKLGKPVSDINTQLDYLSDELKGSEAAAGNAILATKTPGEAAATIARSFLRPAPEHLARRVAAYTGGAEAAPVSIASNDPAALPANATETQGYVIPGQTAPVAAAPVATQAPAINPAIAKALSNPYISDQARGIVKMLFQNQLEQQQKATDPLRQLQIREAQSKLTPLGVPTKDADGNLIQTDPLGKVNVLRPAESKPTSVSEYEYYKANLPQGQQPMAYDTWATAKARAGAMNVTNNVGGGSDKQIFDTFSENTKEARAAANGLVALRSARQALQGPGGAITGFGADEKLTFQKLGAALGVADPASVQNTETFRAAIAPQVASMLKSTVGSANISNSDREFAEKAAGGSIKLDGGSINRLLDIMEKAGTARLELHNQQLDAVYPDPTANKRERALFGVQMPAAPPQPEQPAQQPVTNGAIAVNPKTGERRVLQNGKWVPVL